MKIVHIHSEDGEDRGAGAHIMMNRLHHGLKKNRVESKIICARKTEGFQEAVLIKRSVPIKIAERLLGKVTLNLGFNELHNFSCLGIKRLPDFKEADLVHIHGLHGGFFSYPFLPALAKQKPIVYTLHDMWSFTGHCTSSFDCERWKSGCGKCPYPENYPAIRRDNTHLEWKLKNWIYSRVDMDIVSMSKKQEDQVRQSMLSRFPLHQIKNGIDTRLYQPGDSEKHRADLGIEPNRKVIMFGATDMMRLEKGGDLLVEALKQLPPSLKSQVTLLSFGRRGEEISARADIHSVDLGYVEGDAFKASLYSAADIFVLPSRQESCPLVILESMACTTPIVSFPAGAAAEMVQPERTGYLARAENPEDLCRGMVQLLEDDELRVKMGGNCRKLIQQEFDQELHVQRYQNLYSEILNRPKYVKVSPKR